MKDGGGRLYYSIGEVSEMLDVKPHTLHYWESAFPSLKPHKNQAGNRCYRPGDIELIKLINRLVNQEGFSIEGARKQLDNLRKSNGQMALDLKSEEFQGSLLDEIYAELESIVRNLSGKPQSELDD
jgi:DNA-binding transcriptional MerR regulator